MSPLKPKIVSVAFFIMATGLAASAAQIDKQTQEILELRPIQAPDTSWLRQNDNITHTSTMDSQPRAASSNGVLYSLTDYFDTQALATCWAADGSTFAAYATRSIKGVYSIYVDGLVNPLVSDDKLPGGQTLSNNGVVQMGCSRDNNGVITMFFMAVDPNRKFSTGAPYTGLWIADSNGNIKSLIPVGQTFAAKDIRTGLLTTFTATQVSFVGVRNNKASLLVIATPPQQAPAIPPLPQGLFVLVSPSGQVDVEFNNLKDVNNNFYFSIIAGIDHSDGSLYIAGQLTDLPPTIVPPAKTSSLITLCRIINGKPVQVKDYYSAAGSIMNSWNNGLQLTSVDSTGTSLQFSWLPDNSLPIGTSFNTGEVQLFSGTVIDGVTLSLHDAQFPVGPKELYIISTNTGALIDVNNGTAHLVHAPSMNPGGNARGIIVAGGQIIYVQNQGNVNYTYNMYIPALAQNFYSGLPGNIVPIDGTGLVVDGVLPSVTLNIGGKNVQFGAESTGRITVSIPNFATPGTYNGIINVGGVVLPLKMIVLAPDQAAPLITSVLNGANFQPDAPVAREHISIFFSKATGTQASYSSNPTYELGGISAQLDGTPMPLIYNSGNGQLNAVVPKAALGKNQANVTLVIKYPNGNTATSQPFSISIGPVDDSFFQFVDADGKTLPIVTHVNGSLVSKANPALAGETVVGYGTGCSVDSTKLPEDNQLTPAAIPSAVTPAITLGGQAATVTFAGLPQGFIGLCQYNIVIPLTAGSGDNSMSFSGTAYTYTLRVK